MLVKVCGLKYPEQLAQLDRVVDFIGFIFHPSSPRFLSHCPPTSHTKRVGVFVNAELADILEKIDQHSLDYIQLHGNESPELCSKISLKVSIIKAFGIDEDFDFSSLEAYVDLVDFFLFDTKTAMHGGSGRRFNWELLQKYTLSIPFLLSGGISPSSVSAVNGFSHPSFAGIDLNSGFEITPAKKDIHLIKTFLSHVNNY